MKTINIREYRIKVGISQAKLAKLIGIRQAILSQWELDKTSPSETDIAKIIRILDSLDNEKLVRLKKKNVKHKTTKTRSVYETAPVLPNLFSTNSLFSYKPDAINERIRPKSIGLFSGCGGFSLGVQAAGFDCCGFVELNDDFRKIFKANFPNVQELGTDITKILDHDIEAWKKQFGHISLVYGGPPCQGFSLTGKRDVNDPRNILFRHFVRVINILEPDVAIMENVRLMTSMKTTNGYSVPAEVRHAFNEIGYSVAFKEMNAQDFGVPQSRERVFFIALKGLNREKEISFPTATHGTANNLFLGELKPFITFRDATSDLEPLESGQSSEEDPWHFAVDHPQHVINWLKDVPEGCSAHENKDPEMRPPSGYNTTYKRLKWDEPSSTISTTFGMISGSRNVHPLYTRSLTIREALRCQSFPDDYKLLGTLGAIRTTIGNAVPPTLARAIALHVRKELLKII